MDILVLVGKIIRFFTDSPILFVILFGVIGSIIAKRKGTTNRMPSFGGDAKTVDTEEQDETMETYSEMDPSLDSMNLDNRPMVQPALQPVNRSFGRATTLASTLDVPRASEVGAERSNIPLQPTQDELVKSVVWAEILGPPRAKKPYHRR